MKLAELLMALDYERIQKTKEPVMEMEIERLANDSRKCKEKTLFVCIRGFQTDGGLYAAEAVQKGAVAVVTETEIDVPETVAVIFVKNARKALAELVAAFYGYPAEELKIIGITGTKGKTTTSYMIREMLLLSGHKTGLIGTIEIIIGEQHIAAANTSPESIEIQSYLRRMADAGCDTVVMEVSSQALKLYRTHGILFDTGVFTNLAKDHISPYEHEDFEDYLKSKALLFGQCRVGIGNVDSPWFAQVFAEADCEIRTVGIEKPADYMASDIVFQNKRGELGLSYRLCEKEDNTHKERMTLTIPGMFNVYNSLTAAAVCRRYGVGTNVMKAVLKTIKVRGRTEPLFISGEFTFLIDYAHNAMSLESLLKTIRAYEPGRLVCIFGCGGNRARGRRYEMGETAGRLADFTIVTSDNPRNEDPEQIISDIRSGIKRTDGAYICISDRKEAVRYAVLHARPKDVIILAGKGHETYQEIHGIRYDMDDRELVREVMAEI